MDSEMFKRILNYIDEHICEKIELAELSELAGYSPFYFSKLFSENMGMPVTGYIRIRKLQYAMCSLLEGEKVLDVAVKYAFESHEGFTRSFTKLFGSTPSTVRKYLTTYSVPVIVVPELKYGEKAGRITMSIAKEMLEDNMHQMVFEVLRASMDEVQEGFCTKIEIALLEDGSIKITDNGRGIAQHEIVCVEEKHASGMEMILKPDKMIFGDCRFSEDVIKDWIQSKKEVFEKKCAIIWL